MKRAMAFAFCLPLFAATTLIPINEAGFQRLSASHKGKVVVYDFWATWCAPCRAELPQLVKLEAKLRSQGVVVITISADEPDHKAAAEKFIERFGVQGPAYLKQAENDDHFINSIDPKWGGALPAMFLYDKSGHKVRSFIGQTNIAKVEAAIHKLL
ncbi:MAG TPA: TlpA disulfide reductase family protein [Bryobacteraceae bacterium]|nr:TlpA disulfide reductase family protein [Bryobacteraceae bacterium]